MQDFFMKDLRNTIPFARKLSTENDSERYHLSKKATNLKMHEQ